MKDLLPTVDSHVNLSWLEQTDSRSTLTPDEVSRQRLTLRYVTWVDCRVVVLTLTPDLLLVRFCRKLVRRPTLFFQLTAQLSHPRAVMIIPLFFLSFHLLIFMCFFSCVKHTLSSFSCRAQLPRTSSWAAPASVAKLACPSSPICTAKTK